MSSCSSWVRTRPPIWAPTCRCRLRQHRRLRPGGSPAVRQRFSRHHRRRSTYPSDDATRAKRQDRDQPPVVLEPVVETLGGGLGLLRASNSLDVGAGRGVVGQAAGAPDRVDRCSLGRRLTGRGSPSVKAADHSGVRSVDGRASNTSPSVPRLAAVITGRVGDRERADPEQHDDREKLCADPRRPPCNAP